MRVPISWLRAFVDPLPNVTALAEAVSRAGIEVELVHDIGGGWPRTVVCGRVVGATRHQRNANLAVVEVDVGAGRTLRTVTGAPALRAPDAAASLASARLAVALPGPAPTPSAGAHDVRPAEFDGVLSECVLLSSAELGIDEDHADLAFLPEDLAAGSVLRDVLRDHVLELAITPDIGRCLSISGFAREVRALVGGSRPPSPGRQPPDAAHATVSVSIEDPADCARYEALIARDLRSSRTPGAVQHRLRLCAQRVVQPFVDCTNYLMFETGQPLHAFDLDRLLARSKDGRVRLRVRRARAGERLVPIHGGALELDPSVLVIADDAGPVAAAGVVGGAETAVDGATRNVVFESACFDPVAVRRSSARLGVRTESSVRFVRGVPPQLAGIALARVAAWMRESGAAPAGATMATVATGEPQPSPRVVHVGLGWLRDFLGSDVEGDRVETVLRSLEFEVAASADAGEALRAPAGTAGLRRPPSAETRVLRCLVPWYRLDVASPADVAEEVVRMIGFDRVVPAALSEPIEDLPVDRVALAEERLRDILVGCGLQEIVNYTATSEAGAARLAIPGPAGDPIRLVNPITPERSVMRRSLLASALECHAANAGSLRRAAWFEIGRTYRVDEGGAVREDRRWAVYLTGPRHPESHHRDQAGAPPFDFHDVRGIVETVAARFGVPEGLLRFRALEGPSSFGVRRAAFLLADTEAGVLGELDASVNRQAKLPDMRLCGAEGSIEALVAAGGVPVRVGALSPFPAMVEDFAFDVPEAVAADAVRGLLADAAAPLAESIVLIDVFRGGSLPPGRKSLAFRVVFRSRERTLEGSEFLQVRERVGAAAERVGGRLRDRA